MLGHHYHYNYIYLSIGLYIYVYISQLVEMVFFSGSCSISFLCVSPHSAAGGLLNSHKAPRRFFGHGRKVKTEPIPSAVLCAGCTASLDEPRSEVQDKTARSLPPHLTPDDRSHSPHLCQTLGRVSPDGQRPRGSWFCCWWRQWCLQGYGDGDVDGDGDGRYF